MLQVRVQDPVLILLVEADSQGAANHAKGHLFEEFMARVLHTYGYEQPTREHLNVSADGVELDIRLRHEVSNHVAICECKAYTTAVSVPKITSFYGKMGLARMKDAAVEGLFIAIPRLTADAAEFAREVQSSGDQRFRAINAADIYRMLESRRLIKPPNTPGREYSDPAIVVHETGTYAAALEVDSSTRNADRVVICATEGRVPDAVLEALTEHAYSLGRPVVDEGRPDQSGGNVSFPASHDTVIVEVKGSSSDFEYQLPASPKYFIGRRNSLQKLNPLLQRHGGVFVLNAQSGWGKSSLALKVAAQARVKGAHTAVIDARTASHPSYVPAVIRHVAEAAERAGVMTLPPGATWATLSGAISSLQGSQWSTPKARLLIVFDQFENVFRNEDLTREFRNLAFMAQDERSRLVIGFSWKTDYVSWTENHPYRLRDEIREKAELVSLDPLGARDVDVILKRLEKEVDAKLSREIRQRLREYGQGLPWLLKKLAGHLIREISAGKTQEQLIAEALNVETLFETDLAALNPRSREALNFVARYAPIQAGEVTERYDATLVQSLLDQRLIVQVGEKLDTYWDTFRDYLNTGRVPIEDSYILRQTPPSVARLVSHVLDAGGTTSVADVTRAWNTSENVVWNVARELRQLGLAASAPNLVQLVPEIVAAEDIEGELRRRVAQALRRHRAYTSLVEQVERVQGAISAEQYATRLKDAFPAVAVADSTWKTYARVFMAWFEYAGLALVENGRVRPAPDGTEGKGQLTSNIRSRSAGTAFPTAPPGPSLRALAQLKASAGQATSGSALSRSLGQLLALGAISHSGGNLYSIAPGLVNSDGDVVPAYLYDLLAEVPGGRECLSALESDPKASPRVIGEVIAAARGVEWGDGTIEGAGKSFRAWARKAGVVTKHPGGGRRPKAGRTDPPTAL